MTGSCPLADLVMAQRETILRYLRALGAADRAEDLLHDVWMKAARTPAPEEISRSYVMRMAHNMLVDDARSARQRRSRDDLWHVDGPSSGEVDGSPDAERTLIARERLSLVDKGLSALGSRTAAILRRYRIDGISQRQIADETGVTVSSVEKHLQKAYRRIAELQLEISEGDRER